MIPSEYDIQSDPRNDNDDESDDKPWASDRIHEVLNRAFCAGHRAMAFGPECVDCLGGFTKMVWVVPSRLYVVHRLLVPTKKRGTPT